MEQNQLYNEYRVLELPNDNLKAGDKYHLLKEGNKFITYIVGNDLQMYEAISDYAPQSLSELIAPARAEDIFNLNN